MQLEEVFVSAKREYKAFEDQETLATTSDSEGEAETAAISLVTLEGEEDNLMQALNHCPEWTIFPQTANVNSTTHVSMVRVELSFEDKEEDDDIVKFIAETCGCTVGPKKSPCSSLLSRDTITVTRSNCLQLTQSDADVVMMAQHFILMLLRSPLPTEVRQTVLGSRFFLHGVQICKQTFSFVHAVGKEHLENLCRAVDSNGVVQRIHGNVKQQATEAEVIRLRDFVTNAILTACLYLVGYPMLLTGLCFCVQICKKQSTKITKPHVSKVALLQLGRVHPTARLQTAKPLYNTLGEMYLHSRYISPAIHSSQSLASS